jgi:hypothetical protein
LAFGVLALNLEDENGAGELPIMSGLLVALI